MKSKTAKLTDKAIESGRISRSLIAINAALMKLENELYDLQDSEAVLNRVQKNQMSTIVQDIRNLLDTAEGI